MNRQAVFALSVLLLLAGAGAALSTGNPSPAGVSATGTSPALATPVRQPTSDVVLWLSLDGLRSDYLERANAPHIKRLMREGVYSLELEPIFPAITFPSHVSQATGVRVARHGIPSNTFYDSAADRVYAYPAFGNLLGAEPIW
ncbi:MAG TPA: alkaline phosphatase family protein, partial [Pirellulaceae bacterium]|nr:alkaline phosphatase family protein [Pirellulaceae bacterium]